MGFGRIFAAAWLVGIAIIGPANVSGTPPAQTPPSPAKPVESKALSLADLERMALFGNPTLAQAAAQIEASQGKAQQAGLYPNPTVGYVSDQIGQRGTAGELQGGFVQQTIVTAGKLRLSRAKYNQQAYVAELIAQAQQHRVLNGVRMRFFELLALQRMIELHRGILANSEESLKTHKKMLNAGQANRADVLLAEVAVNDARIDLLGLENRYTAEWEHLIALIGSPQLLPMPLIGKLEPEGSSLDRDLSLSRLLQESPELQAAQAHVVYSQLTVQREKVEPIPDIQLRGALAITSSQETPSRECRSALNSRSGTRTRAPSDRPRRTWCMQTQK